MSEKLTIIANGDSWTFGSEIVSPEITEKYKDKYKYTTNYDYFPDNDHYRVPRCWPTKLGELLNADVVNLAVPADDNGTILHRTITYLNSNYIFFNKPTDNLLVIIGWSSPERNFFWYKENQRTYRFRVWPYVAHFEEPNNEVFWEYYINYLWNEEEYIPRYVMNNILLQSFCDAHNIKWMAFDSFYQTGRTVNNWVDVNIKDTAHNLKLDSYKFFKNKEPFGEIYNYGLLWETVNNKRFYNKDLSGSTFKAFMEKNSPCELTYCGMHPSPYSHQLWASELHNYIKENKIL